MTIQTLTTLFLELEQDARNAIGQITTLAHLEHVYLAYFGAKGEFTQLAKKIAEVPRDERKAVGQLINNVKQTIEHALDQKKTELSSGITSLWLDVTIPGTKPITGHLHIVTQAIEEITAIFARIGFYRLRYPEIDSDWYAFESLNMPPHHPARDEWETFFIENSKFSKIVLTPHTSNGQVREMERQKPPIRMINIAKCYRRQSDVSHVPMFHQFEGLYVDKDVSIPHLKGVLNHFVTQFFGKERKVRIRPFHFQFTEPSFEIDITCDVCNGSGCKLCKEGWLELGGAGMVHPTVLKNGGIDPEKFSGFAFGWGVERTYMMKQGIKIDDIRMLYSNDIRFLQQF